MIRAKYILLVLFAATSVVLSALIGVNVGCVPRKGKNFDVLDRTPRLIVLEKVMGNKAMVAILDLTEVAPYTIPDAEIEVMLAERVSFVFNAISKKVRVVAQNTTGDAFVLNNTLVQNSVLK